jgi:hypothetical protein
MNKKLLTSILLLASPALLAAEPDLKSSLTFYAGFDGGPDAQHAAGDARLYHASSMNKRQEAKPGLPEDGVITLAKNQGKFGDALRFKQKKAPVVFFHADKNAPYRATNWNGTVSFWLSTDPVNDLEPGFCDPIQITPRAWNDAAFFVEFEKRETIPFRLGVYSDFKVWNPKNIKWEQIPFNEKPLITVTNPPFSSGKWTHVLFTFENFNSGKPDGVPTLYLDGKPQGSLTPRQQTFTWDVEKAAIMLGLSYIGLIDELAVFDRVLKENEIAALHELPAGVAGLLK